jgi:precorrin-3B synthase
VTGHVQRPAHDRCPGVFDPHPAADGALARIRLVGGSLRSSAMETLARVAADHGDGFIELTGRANVQLRGITDVAAVADALIAADLVPSTTHEKIRNIEVSALTGRIGGRADVREVAVALDLALRAEAALTSLSGRFLFGVDDGRGDILARRPDVCAVARADGRTDIVIDGTVVGSVADSADVAPALVAVATDMVELAGPRGAWRVRDLDEASRERLLRSAATRLTPPAETDGGAEPVGPAEAIAPIVGWFTQDDDRVLLGAVVEAARVPARLAEFLAAIGAPIVVTPNREILICDLTEGVAETVVRVLAPMGLIFDAASPWARVSCCVGAPGCANAHAAVRADLIAHIASGAEITDRQHWVGCARGCGSPAGPHLRVEAGPDGYVRSAR